MVVERVRFLLVRETRMPDEIQRRPPEEADLRIGDQAPRGNGVGAVVPQAIREIGGG